MGEDLPFLSLFSSGEEEREDLYIKNDERERERENESNIQDSAIRREDSFPVFYTSFCLSFFFFLKINILIIY